MTRDQLIETMARAMCRAKWFGIFPVSILNEKVEGFWKMEVVNATAALTAIEAAGMRVVPMREPVMCSACGSHVGCDCTRMRTGTANWMTIDAALLAAQEDSTSE